MIDHEKHSQAPTYWDRTDGRFSRLGLRPEVVRAAGKVFWRSVLLGTALYLALAPDRDTNLRLNLIFYIVALVWSYYDGFLAKRRWRIAVFEAIFVHLAAVQFGRILGFAFGSPAII